ncbi:TetR family transcriptional regulator [Alcanivorax sp.]|uniref:TetR family transcriptional regulator n=1 Tax=Alcanivorax sp. TaxID=1872427 RepID=UPI000C4F2FA6|nr:TetR family transcriptional regulator [Alcanivorax sp.]MBQ23712.1 TetR family transcriptional regulator [Alcanivorax sp.]|tara:strand:- start:2331 stop:2939 length:609 start_codon:yes stop_codon:yes gene_type:complete
MRRTKEDAEKTRQQIIHSALSLFSQNGYTNTTLANIAAHAGFSRGPIYWHFKNKDELFEAVLRLSQDPLAELVETSRQASGSLLKAIDYFCDCWLRWLVTDAGYRQSFEIFLNKTELTNNLDRTLKKERELTNNLIGVLSDLVSRGQQNGEIRKDYPAEKLGLMCYTQLMGTTQAWLFSPRLFDLENDIPFIKEQILRLLKK